MEKFTLSDLIPHLVSDKAALEFIRAQKPKNLVCPEQDKEPEEGLQTMKWPCLKEGCKGQVSLRRRKLTKKVGTETVTVEEEWLRCGGERGSKPCKQWFTAKHLPGYQSKLTHVQSEKGVNLITTNLALTEILPLAYFWSSKLTSPEIQRMTGLSEQTISHWSTLFREAICHEAFSKRNDDNQLLGWDGEGHVQIIEISIKAKTHRITPGARRGNCGETRDSGPLIFALAWLKSGKVGEIRLFEVAGRDEGTLVPIIQAEVAKGMTIVSDEWLAYKDLDGLEGFQYNFVEPKTRAHTQGQLSSLKLRLMKVLKGTNAQNRAGHLSEEWWRLKHQNESIFLAMLREYPIEPVDESKKRKVEDGSVGVEGGSARKRLRIE